MRVGPDGSGSLLFGVGWGSEGQIWEGVEGAVNIEKLRVGIDVRGEAGVRVTHRGLSRPEGNPAAAQEGAEGRSEGVNVEGAASLITLGDIRS